MDTTTLHIHLQTRTPHYIFMNSFSSKLNRINIKTLCTSTATAAAATSTSSSSSTVKPKTPRLTKPAKITSAAALQFKQNWLDSLTFPPLDDSTPAQTPNKNDPDSKWVIGIDPDLSGALAVLKTDDSGCSALVHDSPRVPILIGGKVRKRLDVKSIIQLLRSLDAPLGTSAYIEQSVPYPKDGKQGWWSGGFGYGLWIGVLVASGFSVIPVPTIIWKNEFELYGGTVTKDDSRRVASTLFPSLSSQLKRKKDHGRAEALLIAAYGNGLKKSDLPCLSPDDLLPSTSGNL